MPYVMSGDLLAAETLDGIVHLVVGEEFGVGKNLLVQSPRIGNDPRDVFADISAISPRGTNVAISGDMVAIEQEVLVQAAGG